MKILALTLAASLSAFATTEASVEPSRGARLYEIDLFDVVPRRAPQAAALLARYAAAARAAPGCLRVDLIRQPEPTDNHFALLVVWRGASDRDRQISSTAARSFRADFQTIAASPVDERLYREVTP